MWVAVTSKAPKNIPVQVLVSKGPWLAQSLYHVTLDLGVMSSSPKLGTKLPKEEEEGKTTTPKFCVSINF